MRNFVILLLLLNAAYLAWNTGLLGSKEKVVSTTNVAIQQADADKSLMLLSEASLESELVRRGLDEAEGLFENIAGLSTDTELEQAIELSLDSEEGSYVQVSFICSSVGLFSSADSANALAFELSAMGYGVNVAERVENVRQNYWLHMPPFNSLVAARQQLDRLQESGIDSYIITENEGELAQGISLGLFAQLESAVTLQAQYAEQGFPSSISEVFRSNTEFWLDVDALLEPEFTEFTYLELLNANSGLKVEEKLCETIAP